MQERDNDTMRTMNLKREIESYSEGLKVEDEWMAK